MEQTSIQEILNALNLHSKQMEKKLDEFRSEMNTRFEEVDRRFEQVDKRFEHVDKRFEQVDKRFDQMDKRFDRLEKKVDGIRVELTETQETVDFLSSKNVQHEKKLRTLAGQEQ